MELISSIPKVLVSAHRVQVELKCKLVPFIIRWVFFKSKMYLQKFSIRFDWSENMKISKSTSRLLSEKCNTSCYHKGHLIKLDCINKAKCHRKAAWQTIQPGPTFSINEKCEVHQTVRQNNRVYSDFLSLIEQLQPQPVRQESDTSVK